MAPPYQVGAAFPSHADTSFMARIVMKFGGTSMAGIERIRHVAGLVKREAEAGNEVAVVVSAMAGETDRLIQFCREASSLYDPREYDVVVASGEQVTSGLLAITLQGMGLNARSYMGWQLPIRTSGHAAALIEGIDAGVLERVFSEGGIAVIPASRASPPMEAWRRSAAAAPTRRRSRLPPPSGPTGATSIPTSTGSTRPIPHRPKGKKASDHHIRGNAGACERWCQGPANPLGRARYARANSDQGPVLLRRQARHDGGGGRRTRRICNGKAAGHRHRL
jgi:hypothetical protein